MASVIDDVVRKLEQRRDELEGLIEEHQRVVAALEAIQPANRSGRPRRSSGRSSTSSRRRTRRKQARRGERSEQILAILGKDPQAKARQIADQLGTAPQNVYQQLRRLEQTGAVKRGKQGYSVKG